MTKQVNIRGQEFVVSRKLFTTLRPKDEWDIDIIGPDNIIKEISDSKNIRADIFSFRQRLPYTKPLFGYHLEMENAAAIRITSYDAWWKEVNRRVRMKVNKAQRLGVVVRICEFDDDLVLRIKEIFDESAFRQGGPFLHYKKSFNYVKERMGTFTKRADFFCAFYGDEPIGILKLVYTGRLARMMTLIGKISHRDKAPVNALLSKAVERCVEKGVSFLTYGQLYYGKKGLDSLAHFKVHNAFRKYDIPRYYIPLSTLGNIYISLRLYRRLKDMVPNFLAQPLRVLRAKWHHFYYGSTHRQN